MSRLGLALGWKGLGLVILMCGSTLSGADELPELGPEAQAEDVTVATETPEAAPEETSPVEPLPQAPPPEPAAAFRILDTEVPPGKTMRLSWSASQNFAGMDLDTPVLVAHGAKPGPVLCLTAAIHGDELNGIEMVRRVLYSTDPQKLRGTLIGVPIVNLHGFQRSSRYLADRRDLNRHFPGHNDGSSASRIARSFFRSVVRNCHALVDLHTGSFHRTNLPQLRADLSDPGVVALTSGFGATSVLEDKGAAGTLRRAAVDAGIPSVTLEAGEPMRLQLEQVEHGVKAIQSLMSNLGMLKKGFQWNDPQPVYYESSWVRANRGGILLSTVKLGTSVKKGDLLGTVTDPITNVQSLIYAPYNGRVLGRALNQVVMPGFAAFHIGVERSPEEVASEASEEKAADESGGQRDVVISPEDEAVEGDIESIEHPE